MTDDNKKYVLREEWVDDKGKIYERINKDKLEYNDKLNELNIKVERQTDVAQRSLESQERQEKNQEEQKKSQDELNATMRQFGNDFIEVKYKVQSHDEKIKAVQGTLAEKKDINLKMMSVIIGGIFSVIVAAIGAAQWIFT